MLDSIINLFRGSATPETDEQRAHRLALIDGLTYEVIPLKSLDAAIEALPPGSRVSVTASPAKGLEATQEITERLLADGFHAIPHISARMVRDKAHTVDLAGWMRSAGVATMFLVGGDAEEPGDYFDAASFLNDFLETDHGLDTIGITAYPDSHPLIDKPALHDALHEKQALLAEAQVAGYCSTQMCFDAKLIASWLATERQAGMNLPVHLGIAGVVDRARLLTMGVRLGIGQSLSYLRKNRNAITKMMTKASYDPNDLLRPLSPELAELGVDGLHVFTFNQVEATAVWRAKMMA
jgi:methylenetetrahydrofolate reductase (NADPH)